MAVEEQLHRASNAGLHQSPSDNVMQLHSRYNDEMTYRVLVMCICRLLYRFTDLDCLADGHQMLIKDCVNGNKNAIMLMRKGIVYSLSLAGYNYLFIIL